MRTPRIIIITALVMLIGTVNMAQTPFRQWEDITPSVNAYAMGKYGDFKPSLYTGAMSYTLPVYTYRDNDFTIPLSLRYNYDGFRPAACSGEIGLGWSLDVGGVITREIRGVADERDNISVGHNTYSGYLLAIQSGATESSATEIRDNKKNFDFLEEVYIMEQTGDIDGDGWGLSEILDPIGDAPVLYYQYQMFENTPDIFHFNMMGMKGEFMLFPDGSIKVFNSSVPYGELSVDLSVDYYSYAHTVMTIHIRTGDGTVYTFGGSVSSNEYAEHTIEHDSSAAPSDNDASLEISAIKLSSIKSPSGRTVSFDYSDTSQSSISGNSARVNHVSYVYGRHLQNNQTHHYNNFGDEVTTCQMQHWCPLERIRIDGKEIFRFNYSPKEQNESAPCYFYDEHISEYFASDFGTETADKLTSIEVTNNVGDVIQRMSLAQSFSTMGTPKMFLDSVCLLTEGEYSFEYEPRDDLPVNDTRCTDWWGFWNDTAMSYNALSLNPLGPGNRFSSGSLYHQFNDPDCTIKSPSFLRTKVGALKRIVYPTGGCSDILYEQNTASYLIYYDYNTPPCLILNSYGFDVGGLRVQSISSKSHIGSCEHFQVSYTYSEGTLQQMPRMVTPLSYFLSGHSLYFDINYMSVGTLANMSHNNYISYKTVTETFPDGSHIETDFYDYNNYRDKYAEYQGRDWCTFKLKYMNDLDARYHTIGSASDIADYGLREGNYICGFCSPIIRDLSCIRGLPKEVREYTSSDNLKSKVKYLYDIKEVAVLDTIWYNNITSFLGTSYYCLNPELERTTSYEYQDDGTYHYQDTRNTYNDNGQIIHTETTAKSDSCDICQHFRYLHETDTSSLRGILSDAVKTRVKDGAEMILTSEHYEYESSDTHAKPSSIRVFDIPLPTEVTSQTVFDAGRSGTSRLTQFSYDDSLRVRDVILPGGDSLHYVWNGNNLISKTQGGTAEGNTSRYDWRDLVGLTKVESPSGISESYLYDEKNRLHIVKDGADSPVTKYEYGIKNEQ